MNARNTMNMVESKGKRRNTMMGSLVQSMSMNMINMVTLLERRKLKKERRVENTEYLVSITTKLGNGLALAALAMLSVKTWVGVPHMTS